jgi:acetate kinase
VRVLVVNAGSSSVKLSLIGRRDQTEGSWELDSLDSRPDSPELHAALNEFGLSADAIGHRIVHGGDRLQTATVITDEVKRELRDLTELAPLHQPKSLAALDAVTAELPGLPSVACFDTAFHRTMQTSATTYAIPLSWRERWGIKRYGFHGLSHAWVAQRTPQLVDGPSRRIVSCHLGAGASLCAIGDGRSVDTTMGFTPLEGLVMATRSGSVDPGMLLWLLDRDRISRPELSAALEHQSGLLGLAGTADMREVLSRAAADDRNARLALDVYVHRLRAGIASMAAALGGLDVLAFTGGIGEHLATVRSSTAAGLGFLGVELDPERNERARGDAQIGAREGRAAVLVIAAREDLEIARQVRTLLQAR